MSEASRGTEWGKVENLDTPCEDKAAGGQAQCSLRMRIWLSAGDWQSSTGGQGKGCDAGAGCVPSGSLRGLITQPLGRSMSTASSL